MYFTPNVRSNVILNNIDTKKICTQIAFHDYHQVITLSEHTCSLTTHTFTSNMYNNEIKINMAALSSISKKRLALFINKVGKRKRLFHHIYNCDLIT